MKLKRPKAAAVPKEIPVSAYAAEYDRLREDKKRIEKRMEQLSTALKDYAEKHGQRDSNGSFYFERDNYVIGKQARKSVSFDTEKASKFFRRKGFPEAIKTVESIDEDVVSELLDTGDITLEDLEKITTTTVRYSMDLKPLKPEEEVTDEVQECTVSRPKLKRR